MLLLPLHILFFLKAFESYNLIPESHSLLKLLFCSQFFHFLLHGLEKFSGIAFQN